MLIVQIEDMPRETISSHILRVLAAERRAIVADWRFYLAYLRVATSEGFALPDPSMVNKQVARLIAGGDIQHIEGVHGVYRVTAPYASVLPGSEEAVLQEANPVAVFSYFTAVQYHNLTYEVPKSFHLTHYPLPTNRLPLGTTTEDWTELPDPKRRRPKSINNLPVSWHSAKQEWDFGHEVGYLKGSPVYVTDLERTLIDITRFPQRAGGPGEVLRSWAKAKSRFDKESLIRYTVRFGQSLLKQRVGFILECMHESHATLDEWATSSVRGSSARLFGKLDFSSSYSTRWNLSINFPIEILQETHD